MNSTELTNLAEWKKWGQSVVLEAPLAPGIYVFRLAEGKAIPRMRGASDIIYIGRSAKIRNRFKDHLRRRKMPNAVCSQSMTRTTSSFHH